MKVTVHLLGQARQLAGTSSFTADLPTGTSVDDALPAILAAADPRLATILATSDGTLRPSVLAILHDEVIDPNQPGLLREGDELSLLPAMSGG